MMGYENDAGVIPRLCKDLFERIAQKTSETLSFKVEASYMEVCEGVIVYLCLCVSVCDCVSVCVCVCE
jgi:hypothetical protein